MRMLNFSDELIERAEIAAERWGISVEEFFANVIETRLAHCDAVRAQMTEEQWSFIDNAERTALLTIVPEIYHGARTDDLASYPVVAARTLTEAEAAASVVALYETMLSRPDWAAGCFVPRHALVFERGSLRFEILLCFQCAHALYTDHLGRRGGFPIGVDHNALETV